MPSIFRGLFAMSHGQVRVRMHAAPTLLLNILFIISGLMDKDDMGNLGFADLHKNKQEKPLNSTAKET